MVPGFLAARDVLHGNRHGWFLLSKTGGLGIGG